MVDTVTADTKEAVSNGGNPGTVDNAEGNGGSMYEGVGKVVAGTGAAMEEAEAAAEKAAKEELEEEHADGEDGEGDKDDAGDGDKSEDGGEDKAADEEEGLDNSGGDYSKENNYGYVDETNEPVFSAVIDVLKEAEVPRNVADTIFKEAMKTGDLDKINVALLEDKVGKATAKMIINNLTDYKAKTDARVAEQAEIIYGEVGGKESWDKLAEWSKTAYNQAEVDEINAMLAKGGKTAKIAVKAIQEDFKASPDYKEEAKLLTPEGGTASAEGALDKTEYYTLYDKESQRVGGPRASVLQSLNARRQAGRKMGI